MVQNGWKLLSPANIAAENSKDVASTKLQWSGWQYIILTCDQQFNGSGT